MKFEWFKKLIHKKRLPLTLTVLFSLFALLSPLLFTTQANSSRLDFTCTGQIGDTIGGLTAPVIGLLNAILLYLTLRRQDDENKRTKKRQRREEKTNRRIREEQQINREIDLLREMIQRIYFAVKKDSSQGQYHKYAGERALFAFIMFSGVKNGQLRTMNRRFTDWMKFVQDLKNILEQAIKIIEINHDSSLRTEAKQSNYNLVKSIITWVVESYNAAVKYEEKFRGDPSIEKFTIDMILEFKKEIDLISFLTPDLEISISKIKSQHNKKQ